MTRRVTAAADRLLSLVVPAQKASACTGPECWTEYTCTCRHRACCITWQNQLCCGAWQGLCCY